MPCGHIFADGYYEAVTALYPALSLSRNFEGRSSKHSSKGTALQGIFGQLQGGYYTPSPFRPSQTGFVPCHDLEGHCWKQGEASASSSSGGSGFCPKLN